jgi:hypothetical protein
MKSAAAGTRHAYEHPPIAGTDAERCADAMRYYHEERLGWSVLTICEKAGISKTSFYKAKKHETDPLQPAVVGKQKKPFLSEAAFTKLEARVTKISLKISAPESTVQFLKLTKEVMREEAGNEFLDWEFSATWLRKLKQRFLVFDKADKKSPSRVKAFEVIRNPVSLCALLWSLFRRGLDPELIYSSDDVSVLLNRMNDKPQVITTKVAKELLQEQNIGISAQVKEQKQRVVCFNLTISSMGCLICKVLKFADRKFTAFREKPKVIELQDSNTEKLYVMFYEYGMEDKVVEETMYRKCIEPEILAHRKSVQKRGFHEVESSQGSSAAESTAPVAPAASAAAAPAESATAGLEEGDEEEGLESDDEDDYVVDDSLVAVVPPQTSKELEGWGAMFCDGAFGQVTALMTNMTTRIKKKDLKLVLGKYAGGCSMSQSANDQGKMHNGLHTGFKSPSFRYQTQPDRPGEGWVKTKKILIQYIDPASRESVWKCMQASQDFLAKAFQPLSIKSAYRKSGVWPFHPAVILSKCPRFRELTTKQAKRVLESLDEFADIIDGGAGEEMGKGRIPEERFLEILGRAIDDTPDKIGKPLNQMGAIRQRASILNHDVFQEDYAEIAVGKEVAKETKANKKRAKEADEGDGEETPAKKKKKIIACSNPSCNAQQGEQGGSSSSSSTPGQGWTKCSHVRCSHKFCPKKSCQKLGAAHENVCSKPKKMVQFNADTKGK